MCTLHLTLPSPPMEEDELVSIIPYSGELRHMSIKYYGLKKITVQGNEEMLVELNLLS